MADTSSPTRVSNIHVAGLCDMVTQYAIETKESQSASIGGVYLEHDMTRVATYLDSLDRFVAAANKKPLDSPKSNNLLDAMLKTFPADDEIQGIENIYVKQICLYFRGMWNEAARCQSADLTTGFLQPDAQRLLDYVDSCRDVLNMASTLIDMPENRDNVPIPGGGEQSARGQGQRFARQ